MAQIKSKWTVGLIAVCVLGISLWNCFKPDNEISVSERRKLKQFPTLSVQTVLNGDFMEDFESYAADQFLMRDEFRTLKAVLSNTVFRQSDQNGMYIANGYAVDMEYPMNEASISYAAQRFRNLYERYMEGTDVSIYGVIVPDKNYFLAKESGHLSMDYDAFCDALYKQADFINDIDVRALLSVDDYYRTDPHWKQESLKEVAAAIAKGMGVSVDTDYEEVIMDVPFYGAYHRQIALPLKADTLVYLTNESLKACRGFNYETMCETTVYDMEKAYGQDAYEMFLGGSVSLLTIENPSAESTKELIIFRDSFGSSLAPLLTEAYSKITMVDIRYIQSEKLGQLIDFDNQDVLFLYSTSVLNHSNTLK
jgi:hypothetical protein